MCFVAWDEERTREREATRSNQPRPKKKKAKKGENREWPWESNYWPLIPKNLPTRQQIDKRWEPSEWKRRKMKPPNDFIQLRSLWKRKAVYECVSVALLQLVWRAIASCWNQRRTTTEKMKLTWFRLAPTDRKRDAQVEYMARLTGNVNTRTLVQSVPTRGPFQSKLTGFTIERRHDTFYNAPRNPGTFHGVQHTCE